MWFEKAGARAEELEERTSELEERTSEHVECKAEKPGARRVWGGNELTLVQCE